MAVTLKKISPQGLVALDGTIDMVINAYNTYLAVKNSIDKWNALAQGVKFNPDQGLSADKLKDMMMQKAESAGTLPSQAPPEIPVSDAVPLAEAKPIVEAKPVAEAKQLSPVKGTKPIKGGRKKKSRKNTRKKRTKKKSRKHSR